MQRLRDECSYASIMGAEVADAYHVKPGMRVSQTVAPKCALFSHFLCRACLHLEA